MEYKGIRRRSKSSDFTHVAKVSSRGAIQKFVE
jgi:hypothetical protein